MAGAAKPLHFLFENLHQSFSHLVSKRGAQQRARLQLLIKTSSSFLKSKKWMRG